MSFKQLRTEVVDNIKEALSCYDVRDTEEAEEFQEDIDFWYDPEIVLYNSDLGSEEIEAATYDDIDVEDDYLGRFLSSEICRTYLSTRDFALVVGVSDDDEHGLSLCVGVIDRSTGVAMINASNLLDAESLQQFAEIATHNAKEQYSKVPIVRKYQRMASENNKLSKVQMENSQRRLTSLLSEIDQHVLSRYLGKEVKADEAL
jgi:hypothetical protein